MCLDLTAFHFFWKIWGLGMLGTRDEYVEDQQAAYTFQSCLRAALFV